MTVLHARQSDTAANPAEKIHKYTVLDATTFFQHSYSTDNMLKL